MRRKRYEARIELSILLSCCGIGLHISIKNNVPVHDTSILMMRKVYDVDTFEVNIANAATALTEH